MKQKTLVAINAFACGAGYVHLMAAIRTGNAVFGLITLGILIVQSILFIWSYCDD